MGNPVSGTSVFGESTNNVGVAAESQNAEAMNAACHSAKQAAIIAISCLETVIRS